MPNDKQMSIRVPEDTYQNFKKIAKETNYPMGKILDIWVRNTETDPEKREFITSVNSGGG